MKKNGFTLIELMVTIAMIGITLTFGVPLFQETIRSNRMAAQYNEFVATMNYARSEAVKRTVRVSVCASNPEASGNSPQTQCTGAWDTGWLIFTDVNGNCAIDNGTDERLRVHGGLTGTTLNAVTTTDGAAATCFGYLPNGASANKGTGTQFTLTDAITKKSRVMTISLLGHLTSQTIKTENLH
jgi:type IV fimbrial biogenesis protein FimT